MKAEFKPLTKEEYIIKRTGLIPAKAKKAIRKVVGSIVKEAAKSERRNLTRQRTGLLGKSLGSTVKTLGNESTVGKAGARAGFRVTLKAAIKGSKTTLTGTKSGGKEIKLKGNVNAVRTRGKNKGEAVKLSPANYAHLVEGGHKRGGGKGAAKPYPFISKAAKEANRTAPGQLTAAITTEVKTA